MPAERPLYDNHDYMKPPVGRVSNCRLKRMDDDVLAIVCDVEIFDEELAEQWRGLSIGFHRAEVEAEAAPTEFAISFNPRSTARADMEAVQAEFGADRVGLVERREKSLELGVAAAIYIVSHGFVDEAGADLYRLWKATLLKALKRDEPPVVAIRAPSTERAPEFLLIPSPEAKPDDLILIDCNGMVEQARELAPGNDIVKVVARVSDGGFAYLDHAVDAQGATIRPPG